MAQEMEVFTDVARLRMVLDLMDLFDEESIQTYQLDRLLDNPDGKRDFGELLRAGGSLGIDARLLDRIFAGSPTGSLDSLTQMLGRGTHLSGDDQAHLRLFPWREHTMRLPCIFSGKTWPDPIAATHFPFITLRSIGETLLDLLQLSEILEPAFHVISSEGDGEATMLAGGMLRWDAFAHEPLKTGWKLMYPYPVERTHEVVKPFSESAHHVLYASASANETAQMLLQYQLVTGSWPKSPLGLGAYATASLLPRADNPEQKRRGPKRILVTPEGKQLHISAHYEDELPAHAGYALTRRRFH